MVCDIEELRAKVSHLPRGVLEHIYRVVDISFELAHRFCVDPEKVEIAALLHDVARVTKGDELLKLAREFGTPITPLEKRLPVFLHGPVGAELARRDFHIQDEEILEAIRCHTVGKADMGPVACVLFLADKLDPAKDARYPFNERVRELAQQDLDKAIVEFISCEVSTHITRGDFVHPSTIETRNDLLTRINLPNR